MVRIKQIGRAGVELTVMQPRVELVTSTKLVSVGAPPRYVVLLKDQNFLASLGLGWVEKL